MPNPALAPINVSRFRTSLKMAISKLQFIQEKKSALTKQQRRQLADLLSQGKESSATIRVENIIRDDIYIELLEYLELYCELLLARIMMVTDVNRPTCDDSLVEAVHSVIFAAPHTELKELTNVRDILIHKYGPEFGKKAMDTTSVDNRVSEKVLKRCQVDPPSETLVRLYLCEIAKVYNAPYSGLKALSLDEEAPKNDDDDNDGEGGIGEKNLEAPLPATSAVPPETQAEPKPANDFDALKARFAALKR